MQTETIPTIHHAPTPTQRSARGEDRSNGSHTGYMQQLMDRRTWQAGGAA